MFHVTTNTLMAERSWVSPSASAARPISTGDAVIDVSFPDANNPFGPTCAVSIRICLVSGASSAIALLRTADSDAIGPVCGEAKRACNLSFNFDSSARVNLS